MGKLTVGERESVWYRENRYLKTNIRNTEILGGRDNFHSMAPSSPKWASHVRLSLDGRSRQILHRNSSRENEGRHTEKQKDPRKEERKTNRTEEKKRKKEKGRRGENKKTEGILQKVKSNTSANQNAVQVECDHRMKCAWATFTSHRQELTSPRYPFHPSTAHQVRGR